MKIRDTLDCLDIAGKTVTADALHCQKDTYAKIIKNGGRIEKRVCRASANIEWLPELPLWAGMQTIFSVTRTVTTKGKTTEEVGYYISSLECNPENFLFTSRSHWKIESMHWMLDVIWHEDTSGILSENGNKVLNSLRKLALLAHKRCISNLTKKPSVKGDVLSALLNDETLLQVISSL